MDSLSPTTWKAQQRIVPPKMPARVPYPTPWSELSPNESLWFSPCSLYPVSPPFPHLLPPHSGKRLLWQLQAAPSALTTKSTSSNVHKLLLSYSTSAHLAESVKPSKYSGFISLVLGLQATETSWGRKSETGVRQLGGTSRWVFRAISGAEGPRGRGGEL